MSAPSEHSRLPHGECAPGSRQTPAPPAASFAALAGFSCRFIAEADVDPALLPLPPAATCVLFTGESVAADQWLALCRPHAGEPTIYVTRKPLRTARCTSLFGLSYRPCQAALISLAGLDAGDVETTRRRLVALAAHELAHLAGYTHCRTPGCLMLPAASPADLDLRRLALCPRCRRRRIAWWAAALPALCLALSVSLDAVIATIRNRNHVFSWRQEGAHAVLMLEREQLLRFRSPTDAQAAAEALDALYVSLAPPPLRCETGPDAPRITAGGRTLFTISAVETGGLPPEEFARRWIARVDPLLQGKGTLEQGCPSCHVDRRAEVLEALARRPRWWRKP